MRKLPIAIMAAALLASAVPFSGAASAKDIKIGILLGFTGPLESVTPMMAKSAEMAIKEVNELACSAWRRHRRSRSR